MLWVKLSLAPGEKCFRDASKTLFWISALQSLPVSCNCDAPGKTLSARNGSKLLPLSLLWLQNNCGIQGLSNQKVMSACVLLQDVTPKGPKGRFSEIWKFFTKNRLAVCLLETVLKMTKGPKSRFKEMSQVKLCPCSRQALQSKFDADLCKELR
jgi:hypothetical protein